MLASARPSAPNSKKSKRAKHRLTRTYSTENLRLRKLIAMNPSPGISTKSVGHRRYTLAMEIRANTPRNQRNLGMRPCDEWTFDLPLHEKAAKRPALRRATR